MSSLLERPVQKYFSGLRPTKLTSRAFSNLHERKEELKKKCI